MEAISMIDTAWVPVEIVRVLSWTLVEGSLDKPRGDAMAERTQGFETTKVLCFRRSVHQTWIFPASRFLRSSVLDFLGNKFVCL